MNLRDKMQVKMRMEGVAISHARTDVTIRGLTTVIDEPIERGGTNLGFSPTETMVAALIGCTNVIAHKIAHKNGIALTSMTIRIEADFDRRGVTLNEAVAIPFPAMTMIVDVTTPATSAAVDRVREELALYCPIAAIVRASGTVLTEVWNITQA